MWGFFKSGWGFYTFDLPFYFLRGAGCHTVGIIPFILAVLTGVKVNMPTI